MKIDPQFLLSVLANFIAGIAIPGAISLGRRVIEWLTSNLEDSVDIDRVKEELESTLLELESAERLKFILQLLIDRSSLRNELRDRAAERLELVQQFNREKEAMMAFVAGIPFYVEKRAKLLDEFRSQADKVSIASIEELRAALEELQRVRVILAPIVQASTECSRLADTSIRYADAVGRVRLPEDVRSELSERLRRIPSIVAKEPQGWRRAFFEMASVTQFLVNRRTVEGYQPHPEEWEAELDSRLGDVSREMHRVLTGLAPVRGSDELNCGIQTTHN